MSQDVTTAIVYVGKMPQFSMTMLYISEQS